MGSQREGGLDFRAKLPLDSEVGTCGCLFKPIEIKHLPNYLDHLRKPFIPNKTMTIAHTPTQRSAKRTATAKPNAQYAQAAKASARFHVAMARKRFGFSAADCDDLEQDLVLLALLQEPQFDGSRASARTFTEMICRQSVGALVYKMAYHQRESLSFDHRDDALHDGAGHAARHLLVREADDGLVELGLDLERVTHSLPAPFAELTALLLTHQSVVDAKDASGLNRSSFYRRLEALKMHLRMFGIRA